MRVLIYGHRGWIGRKLAALCDAPLEGRARVDDVDAVRRELDALAPDRVICCVGRTHGPGCSTIDYLEDKLRDNVRDNLFAPLSLALECQARGLHLTYLGTGCIFAYDEEEGCATFSENDTPNFFGSGYSIVKGFTDRLAHQLPHVLNVRIRMPITDEDHPRNFITKITRYDKICSMPNSMTVLDDLLPLMMDMCRQGTCGTVNLCNPGVMSHNDILALYRDIVDPEFTWANFSQAEQDELLAAGRSNNHMDTTLLESRYPDVPTLREAVTAALQRMAARRRARDD